jgi:5-methylcytosine-specific restriction protein A
MTNPKPRLKSLPPRIAALGNRLVVVVPGSWRTSEQTSTQRGYGYKWQQARAGYLEKHPLCIYCERAGRTASASVVDHIVPHRGDMTLFWDRGNWQGLCVTCHSGTKQREEAAQQFVPVVGQRSARLI